AKKNGVEKVYIHAFTDGRDVAPDSGAGFIRELEEETKKIGVGKLATVTGRFLGMDRDNRWRREEEAYDAIFHGKGKRSEDAVKSIQESYSNHEFDEFLHPIVLQANDQPVGTVEDHDAIVFFNFRPDRAIQLSRAMTEKEFHEFNRGRRPKNVYFATMT